MQSRLESRARKSESIHISRSGDGSRGSVSARYRRPKLRIGSVCLALAVIFCPLALGGVASAKTVSPLKKGLEFYAGQTLTFIIPTTAGSNNDIEARILATAMGQYLHATINVVDNSAGSNITGQDVMAGSTPNGLTFGGLNTGGDILDAITSTPGLSFDPSRLAFLGEMAPPDHTLAVSPTSPYKTFAEMLKAPASDPVTLLEDTGATTLEQYLLLKAFNINARSITGYSGSSALVTGLIRGDGMGEINATGTLGTLFISHQVLPVMVMARLSAGVNYSAITAKTPTIAQLAAKYPPKTKLAKEALTTLVDYQANSGYIYAAPSATPAPEVAALRQAMKYAWAQPSTKTQLDVLGEGIDTASGAGAKASYLAAVKAVNKYAGPLGLAAAAG